MNDLRPRFPDYGESGDLASARRARRAFRLCVVSMALLTGMLWFTERFLRYEHAERLYLSALTLEKPSARVMLLEAIKTDRESRDQPTPKYYQALAVREEDDIALGRYAEAYTLDPRNSLFALLYGAKLFIMGRPKDAAVVFQNAAAHPPQNALPIYLEAACLAQTARDTGGMNEAMVLVARANNSGNPIVLPKPLWSAAMPRDGYWYANLSREIADAISAPLYHFTDRIIEAARREAEGDQMIAAESWLDQLLIMGERLVLNSEPPGTLIAMTGLHVQARCIDEMEKLRNSIGEPLNTEYIERRVNVRHAQEIVQEFELKRDSRIEQEIREYRRSFILLFEGGACLFGAYLIVVLGYKITGLRKSTWALAHSAVGKGVMAGGAAGVLVLLTAFSSFRVVAGTHTEYAEAVEKVWWGLIITLIAFGVLYPALTLTSVSEVSRKTGRPEEMEDMTRLARAAYRRAYMALVVRYYGVLAGLYVCAGCFWIIAYRVLTGLYPWQIKLLASGLLDDEIEIIRRAVNMLG